MKRGDLVIAAVPGDYGKPRPHVVIQTDVLNPTHASVLACPLTTELRGYPYRIALSAEQTQGLDRDSEVMTDKLQPIRRDRISRVVGSVSADQLRDIEARLAFVLGLRGSPQA
ncbi:MAG TPA: type II toxin-antitoxin system PemK/MazF family toxin [Caulobacteraceae bacterium]